LSSIVSGKVQSAPGAARLLGGDLEQLHRRAFTRHSLGLWVYGICWPYDLDVVRARSLLRLPRRESRSGTMHLRTPARLSSSRACSVLPRGGERQPGGRTSDSPRVYCPRPEAVDNVVVRESEVWLSTAARIRAGGGLHCSTTAFSASKPLMWGRMQCMLLLSVIEGKEHCN
jgi:hypothetical protein